MSTHLPLPLATPNRLVTNANNLFAAVDMGTNTFKLLIVRADPITGRFLTLDRLKESVLLGLDSTTSTISPSSLRRATTALRKFQHLLHTYNIPPSHTRLVATSAVREATNQSHFLETIHDTLSLNITVLSGLEEARLIYLGILQFHPVQDSTVLTVDIGGGSTEFVIGKHGKVLYSASLHLGHVYLTQLFNETSQIREFVKVQLQESGIIEKVKEYCIEKVIGSSGTIRKIEREVFYGNAHNLGQDIGVFDECRQDWRFTKEELSTLVKRMCGEGEGMSKGWISKKRSEFTVAGAVLLEEIFQGLGIEEMEVSGYALGEGVIAEKLREVYENYDSNANARWRGVVRLAARFNNKKRMKAATLCAGMAKEIFLGLRKWNENPDDANNIVGLLEDKDLEYLEAACLLHNIGHFTGKKGYHKQSYKIIMNGGHLHGYDNDEIMLIALLVRYHRKKFPKYDHGSLEGQTEEVKQRFRLLCTIVRVSFIMQQYQSGNSQNMEILRSREGFKLVFGQGTSGPPSFHSTQPTEDIIAELDKELDYFRMIVGKKLSVVCMDTESNSEEKDTGR